MDLKVNRVGDPDPSQPDPLKGVFSPALNDRISKVADPALRSELAALIVEVEDKSRKLLSTRGNKDFEDYKAAVKRFVKRAVQSSFKVEEKQSQKRDGKFVVYLTVEKVDEALENLAQLLVAGQQSPMRVVATLDEIRGMLMDFYL
ncbi:MAG TPA: YaaR family protein [bacterium]|nr:YaaR family protein [bacterium]